jgi:hypothetical protein
MPHRVIRGVAVDMGHDCHHKSHLSLSPQVSPARDSNRIALEMVLTAINGSPVLDMSQRDVSPMMT